jgi:outer membrane scaffolding protein for murein synthesis (MipA/OmpV family)
MLRALLTLIISSLSLVSHSDEPVPVRENKVLIGAGGTHNSMNYLGLDSLTVAVPVFDIQLGPFFAFNHHDEPFIGLELFRHKRVMLALAATQGRQFLDVSEASNDTKWIYFGIEDRDKSTEAALIFKFFSRVGLLEIMSIRDVSNNYDGFRSYIGWSRPFPETGQWTITPRMFGKYYSEDYNTFYYGISEADMTRGVDIINNEGLVLGGIPVTEEGFINRRPEYQAGNSGHFGVDLTVKYQFTENLFAQGYVGMEKLAGQVTSSTLVEDADIWTVNLALAFQF